MPKDTRSVDTAVQQAILVETILKEERYQKLFTNYSINPFKKSKCIHSQYIHKN